MPIHRTESRDFDNRRNTDWIGENGFWLFYALLIFIIRLLVGLGLLIFTSKQSHYTWTIVNGGHALITFYIMHWAKGQFQQLKHIDVQIKITFRFQIKAIVLRDGKLLRTHHVELNIRNLLICVINRFRNIVTILVIQALHFGYLLRIKIALTVKHFGNKLILVDNTLKNGKYLQ